MKKEKKTSIFNSPLVWLFLSVVVSIFSFNNLLRSGYFPMHDDMQAMRVYEMDKCIHDMQLPCRWVPDMGYGYGYPQFNYYPPTPYYLMEVFHLAGMSILASVKTGFVLSFILSAISMFILGRELFGSVGGFVSSVFYIYNPYRATDVYNRGAVGEFWALVFLPVIFWSVLKIVREPKRKYVLYLALSFAGLLTTHLVTSLIFTPVVAVWGLFLLFFSDKWQRSVISVGSFFGGLSGKFSNAKILNQKKEPFTPKMDILFMLVGGAFWGLLLASFFVLPVIFEKKYAHTETMVEGFFNYLAHFVSLRQMFTSTHWAFGSSELGPYDDFSFSIGLFHWVFGVGSLVVAFLFRKKNAFIFKVSVFLLLVFLASAFMAHEKSSFVWKLIPILEYLQFPWRFLVISVFSISLLAGVGVFFINSIEMRAKMGFLCAALIIFFNMFYFYPRVWFNITDSEKFSGDLWEKQQTISIFDYLPIYAEAPPAKRAPTDPEIINGDMELLSGQRGTDWYIWNVKITSESARVRIPVYDFPGWKVFVDGKQVEIDHNNKLGLITFNLPSGEQEIYAKLTNSPIRNVGNLFSLVSAIAIPVVLRRGRKKGKT